jgi:hypothetical protein
MHTSASMSAHDINGGGVIYFSREQPQVGSALVSRCRRYHVRIVGDDLAPLGWE